MSKNITVHVHKLIATLELALDHFILKTFKIVLKRVKLNVAVLKKVVKMKIYIFNNGTYKVLYYSGPMLERVRTWTQWVSQSLDLNSTCIYVDSDSSVVDSDSGLTDSDSTQVDSDSLNGASNEKCTRQIQTI